MERRAWKSLLGAAHARRCPIAPHTRAMGKLTMRVWVIFLWLVLVCPSVLAAPSRLDRMEHPPAGWSGPVFQPSFRFPAKTADEARPWLAISFRSEPERYLRTLLAYALEGQD